MTSEELILTGSLQITSPQKKTKMKKIKVSRWFELRASQQLSWQINVIREIGSCEASYQPGFFYFVLSLCLFLFPSLIDVRRRNPVNLFVIC